MKRTSVYRRSVFCTDNHCQNMHTNKLAFSSDRNIFSLLQSSVNYSKKAIKNHHGEVPVVVQKKKKKKKTLNTYNTNRKTKQNKNKKTTTTTKKTKLNFEPSTMYLCLGACTTVRVRSTGRLQCEMTQEMV